MIVSVLGVAVAAPVTLAVLIKITGVTDLDLLVSYAANHNRALITTVRLQHIPFA